MSKMPVDAPMPGLNVVLNAHTRPDQALFGIVQGGCFPHLRRESARAVAAFDLPGIAIGGVSVGEPTDDMHRIVRDITPLLTAGSAPIPHGDWHVA